jgi:hypothetical protein
MSNIKSRPNNVLTKIIARTIAIMSLDFAIVIAGMLAALAVADYVAKRVNVGIDMTSSYWNADLAIVLGLISFFTISLIGIFITHRLSRANIDYTIYWVVPLIFVAFLCLVLLLRWRLQFGLGVWQT